jgi:hypothetical protein
MEETRTKGTKEMETTVAKSFMLNSYHIDLQRGHLYFAFGVVSIVRLLFTLEYSVEVTRAREGGNVRGFPLSCI